MYIYSYWVVVRKSHWTVLVINLRLRFRVVVINLIELPDEHLPHHPLTITLMSNFLR